MASVRFEKSPRLRITLVNNATHFLVDGSEHGIGCARSPRIAFRWQHRHRAHALGHPPRADMAAPCFRYASRRFTPPSATRGAFRLFFLETGRRLTPRETRPPPR